MQKLWTGIITFAMSIGLFVPELFLAAGDKKLDNVVVVADSRKLTGLMAWWANLYNESHFYFTLVTVVLIPTIGFIFGVLADVVMKRIGIDLEHRDLAER